MNILVLAALDEELEGIRVAMKESSGFYVGPFRVSVGGMGHESLLLCKCGVGKTNAAAAAAAILTARPDIAQVINTGVAGGIGGGIKRGDIALGERTVHHDYDQTPDGLRKGQVQGFESEFFPCDERMVKRMENALRDENISYVKGTVASGDQFIADTATAKRINSEFGAVACDFESAPIAQVCALYKVPYLAMRAASDDGGDGAVESFYEFLHKAAANNVRALKRYCEIWE